MSVLIRIGILLTVVCALASNTFVTGLRAGAARVSITPSDDEFPFDAPHERPFVGVHDNIYARALVMDDGETRVAIVSLEVTAVPRATQIVAEVAAAAAIPESHVLVAATHTHNSLLVSFHGGDPSPVHAREIARVERCAVEATRQAVAQLKPVHALFGNGEAYVNINNGEEAGLRSSDPRGYSDKSLGVLRLIGDAGEPVAMLVNYATHGEVMFRSATKDGGYEVSGDLPGAVSHLLEGRADAAPVVLFTSAAEGDQLPLFKSLQPALHLDGADEGFGGWSLLDAQARRLANAIIDVAAASDAVANSKLTATAGSVQCPGKKRNAHQEPADNLPIPPTSIPLTLIQIGDLSLEGVGGDLAAQLGQELKNASRVPHTLVITMTAGAVGYILPDASYRQASHGVAGSPIKAGCAEAALIRGFTLLDQSVH